MTPRRTRERAPRRQATQRCPSRRRQTRASPRWSRTRSWCTPSPQGGHPRPSTGVRDGRDRPLSPRLLPPSLGHHHRAARGHRTAIPNEPTRYEPLETDPGWPNYRAHNSVDVAISIVSNVKGGVRLRMRDEGGAQLVRIEEPQLVSDETNLVARMAPPRFVKEVAELRARNDGILPMREWTDPSEIARVHCQATVGSDQSSRGNPVNQMSHPSVTGCGKRSSLVPASVDVIRHGLGLGTTRERNRATIPTACRRERCPVAPATPLR